MKQQSTERWQREAVHASIGNQVMAQARAQNQERVLMGLPVNPWLQGSVRLVILLNENVCGAFSDTES